MDVLKKADEIMNLRSEEKDREYGGFVDSITRAAKIANEMCDVSITAETLCKCLVALKLGRLKYNMKDDTFVDAVAYLDGLHKISREGLNMELELPFQQMNHYENDYKKLLNNVLEYGVKQIVRDSVCVAKAGVSIEFEPRLMGEFPMLTSRKMFFKNVKHELYWLLSGDTSIKYLRENEVTIWDKFDIGDGTIGKSYGYVMSNQIKHALTSIANLDQTRRNVVSLWDVGLIKGGELAPCYPMFQFVLIRNTLSIIVTQRSSDLMVGLPYDIGVFYLLLSLVCNRYFLNIGKVRFNIGNAHIYSEHIEQVYYYIESAEHALPILINKQLDVLNFKTDEVSLRGYKSEPFMKVKLIL